MNALEIGRKVYATKLERTGYAESDNDPAKKLVREEEKYATKMIRVDLRFILKCRRAVCCPTSKYLFPSWSGRIYVLSEITLVRNISEGYEARKSIR